MVNPRDIAGNVDEEEEEEVTVKIIIKKKKTNRKICLKSLDHSLNL